MTREAEWRGRRRSLRPLGRNSGRIRRAAPRRRRRRAGAAGPGQCEARQDPASFRTDHRRQPAAQRDRRGPQAGIALPSPRIGRRKTPVFRRALRGEGGRRSRPDEGRRRPLRMRSRCPSPGAIGRPEDARLSTGYRATLSPQAGPGELARRMFVAPPIQQSQVGGDLDQEPKLLNPQVSSTQGVCAVPCIGRFDQRLEHVQGDDIDAIAEGELMASREFLDGREEPPTGTDNGPRPRRLRLRTVCWRAPWAGRIVTPPSPTGSGRSRAGPAFAGSFQKSECRPRLIGRFICRLPVPLGSRAFALRSGCALTKTAEEIS